MKLEDNSVWGSGGGEGALGTGHRARKAEAGALDGGLTCIWIVCLVLARWGVHKVHARRERKGSCLTQPPTCALTLPYIKSPCST